MHRPRLASPQKQVHWDCLEQEVFAPNIQVRQIPDVLQSTHRLSGCRYLILNVKVVAQAEGYKGSKVLEVMAESNRAIIYINWMRFFELIV